MSSTPVKTKQTSPYSISPMLSETMRNHAKLFGKEPLLSPTGSGSHESDIDSSDIGPLDSVSQSGAVEDTDSTATDVTEKRVCSWNSALLNPSPTRSQMMRDRLWEYRMSSLQASSSIVVGSSENSSTWVAGTPHASISPADQRNKMEGPDNSLSPTMSQMMQKAIKAKSSNAGALFCNSPFKVNERGKTKNTSNEVHKVTVQIQKKSKKVVISGLFSPLKSEFNNLRIYETPKKTDFDRVGEDITRNRHEISPLIQAHLNRTSQSKHKSTVARNIFRKPSNGRNNTTNKRKADSNNNVVKTANRKSHTSNKKEQKEQTLPSDSKQGDTLSSEHTVKVSSRRKPCLTSGDCMCPVVMLNRMNHLEDKASCSNQENIDHTDVISVSDTETESGSDPDVPSEPLANNELVQSPQIKRHRVVISRSGGGTRIINFEECSPTDPSAPVRSGVASETPRRRSSGGESDAFSSLHSVSPKDLDVRNSRKACTTWKRDRNKVTNFVESGSDGRAESDTEEAVSEGDDGSALRSTKKTRTSKRRRAVKYVVGNEDASSIVISDSDDAGSSIVVDDSSSDPDYAGYEFPKPKRKKPRPCRCTICCKEFSDRRALLEHKLIHKDDLPFTCFICNKKFRHASTLSEHKVSVHDNVTFVCRICRSEFASKKSLRIHQRKHSGIKPYQCSYCEKSFALKAILVTHERLHSGDKPFACDRCEKSFSDKSNLRRHSLTHVDDAEKFPFTCTICSKRFKYLASLSAHGLAHTREGRKPFKCHKSASTLFDQRSLRKHMRSSHEEAEDRRHQCTLCDKSFYTKSGLQIHMRKHTGEKPFGCNLCEKTYSDRSNLRQHMKSHVAEGDFRCILCGRLCKSLQSLESHKLQAHGSSAVSTPGHPYKCYMCRQSFKSRQELRDHLNTNHEPSSSDASS